MDDDSQKASLQSSSPDRYGKKSPFRPARQEPLLTRVVPVAGALPRYRVDSARRDLVAGVTVAALAVPSAMAYAELAGLSPVNGLYALLVPSVAYMLLGSSRQLIIGPEGSVSTLIAAAILPLAAPASGNAAELAAMLALLVAICFVAAWVARLGWIADYLSRPVLIGFRCTRRWAIDLSGGHIGSRTSSKTVSTIIPAVMHYVRGFCVISLDVSRS